MLMQKFRLSLILFTLICLSGCANTPHSSYVNYKLAAMDKPLAAQRITILPAMIKIVEAKPGRVLENKYEWSRRVSVNFDQVLHMRLKTDLGLAHENVKYYNVHPTDFPHVSFLQLVFQTIRTHTDGWNAWPHKMNKFDYSVGEGIGFLQQEQVELAIYTEGIQVIQHSRSDANYESMLDMPSNDLVFGDLLLTISMIDTTSGDILWLDNDKYHSKDLREIADIQFILAHVLQKIPDGLVMTKNGS